MTTCLGLQTRDDRYYRDDRYNTYDKDDKNDRDDREDHVSSYIILRG